MDLEQIRHRLRHRDDVVPDAVAAIAGMRCRRLTDDRKLGGRFLRIDRIGAGQRPGIGKLAAQQRDARRLVERGIVVAYARRLEQLRHHALMDRAVLSHVERGQVEPEGLDRADQPPQRAAAREYPAIGTKRLGERFQVRAQRIATRVSGGADRRRARRCVADQIGISRRQPRIDARKRAAIGLVRAVWRGVVGGVGQGLKLGRHLGQFGREAEFGAQGVHLVQIEGHHGPRLGAEGGGHHRGVHVGIAVAVAADPGADAHEGLQPGRLQQSPPGRQLLWRDVQEDAVQEGDHGVDLVLHHQPLGADQTRGPQDDDLAAQRFGDGVQGAGVAGLVAGVQQVGDGGDAVDDALAPDLGRVGGQDGRDQRLIQQGAHGLAIHALIGQTLQRAFRRVGPGAGLGLALGAAAGRAVFGDIGQQRE